MYAPFAFLNDCRLNPSDCGFFLSGKDAREIKLDSVIHFRNAIHYYWRTDRTGAESATEPRTARCSADFRPSGHMHYPASFIAVFHPSSETGVARIVNIFETDLKGARS